MSRAPLSLVVPGERLQTADGPCYLVRREYAVCHHYGGRPLESSRAVPGRTLAALGRDDALAGVTLDQACFLDTETTGLSGGTGTYVFMVGLGYFAGDYFRIDQYFMEDVDQEPGLLTALEKALAGFGAVVSFNGKAFDLPLLETRFILQRRRPPLGSKPHLDLLFPARRLWGQRLESCRLASLEEHILGETRVGDLPGSLVPEHYFRYLRCGDPWDLKPIFDHNHQDVLSLLALSGSTAERFEAFLGDASEASTERLDPLDLYGLARLYAGLGLDEPAIRCYRACLGTGEDSYPQATGDAGLPEPLLARAGLDCVKLLRRLRRTPEAITLCESLSDGYPPRLWPLVEMAKDLEHRARDYTRALAVVDRALGLTEGLYEPEAGSAPSLSLAALKWRRARLARKQAGRTATAGRR